MTSSRTSWRPTSSASAPLDDKEDAAQALSKYDFLAMPVVDQENRLVGIVTVDDAMDVMEEEATEDFEKMAAMLPSDKPYLEGRRASTRGRARHAVADDPDAVGHLHRHDPQPL